MASSDGLATWQDAFEKNTIPNVRSLEKQLRSSILRDKEKLRVLVGGSYRELLSTADEIVGLNDRSQATEVQITELSIQCKPLDHAQTKQETSLAARTAAQLKLLTHCIICATSALRSQSILLSAELTVISRLLLKSLADAKNASSITMRLRAQDANNRRYLLHHINSRLVHPASSTRLIVESIGAYCIITSVSSGDAIKHFQDLRLANLRNRFSENYNQSHQIRESFRYLIDSIRTLRALLSRGLNEVLNTLQRQPILESPAVTQLSTLPIDETRTLIPSDVLAFKPYIKRLVINKEGVNDLVQAWAETAGQVASEGLVQALDNFKTVRQVLALRKELLSLILPVYFSIHPTTGLLESIRKATSEKLLQLSRAQIEVLLLIGKDILSHSVHSVKSPTLWDEAFVHKLTVSEDTLLLRHVQDRHLGIKGRLEKDLRRLRIWHKFYIQLQTQIQDIRSVRWQDLIEEPDDDSEDLASQIIDQLAKKDPASYESSVQTTIEGAIRTFEANFREVVIQLTSQNGEEAKDAGEAYTSTAQGAVFLARALRESCAILAHAAPNVELQIDEMKTKLYKAIARYIVQTLSSRFKNQNNARRHRFERDSTAILEGLPSPLTFSVLRELCIIMAEVGGVDIWSRPAISVLKQALRDTILVSSEKSYYTLNEFDEQYLRVAFAMDDLSQSVPNGEKNGQKEEGEDKAVNDDENGHDMEKKKKANSERETNSIEIAAIAYWNRTKLLFGILLGQ